MAFLTGCLLLDAPASALNNAGADPGARTDNVIAVKKIRTPEGTYPYVSAQAFRYWLRTSLELNSQQWVAAPVFREGKIAYTDANPVQNWDDDLFGYMRAPSKRSDAAKDEKATPLEKDREITRTSPFRVSTFVAVAPSPIVQDFGTMTRQNGDPVPHEHEFYRAHLQGLISLDLSCCGTFFDSERVGYKNLDTYRREEVQNAGCTAVTVRKQPAVRLPLEVRTRRVAELVRGLGYLDGGAKQALHYTDLLPGVIILAVLANGNNPFYRAFKASRTHTTEFNPEAFAEVVQAYRGEWQSGIIVGWAKGFLDTERAKLEALIGQGDLPVNVEVVHPKEAITRVATMIEEDKNAGWFA